MANVAGDGRPSRSALVRWLGSRPGRTQTALAEACGVAQQSISALTQAHGSVPSDALAGLIDLATRGAVAAAGWKTPEERRASKAAIRRASQGVGA